MIVMRAIALLVRCAAWLAPHAERGRWREEWLAELQEIARARGRRAALRVALGLAPDAMALRRLAAERRTSVMTMSSTDLKLAMRMLVRYPGLTAVSVFGMAVGITIAAAALTIAAALMNPALPFDEGDRIVALGTWDVRTNNQEQRTLYELALWRAQLRSVEDLGAFRLSNRNLIGRDTRPETVSVAEISASAFRVTRVGPALGRPLLDADEHPGAPDVVVIGDEVWKRRFAADPGIVGRVLQLGTRQHTIVGVMPPGYAFPISHQYWIPLRLAPAYEPLTGPGVTVFARLAPGVTIDAAQAEVNAVGQRVSAGSPATHEHLRARLLPYTHVFTDMDDPDGALVMRAFQTIVLLLLGVVCVNVAILVYARTATRQGEIAVRSALGASRRRIVSQLFVEALALAGVAAIVSVALLSAGFTQLDAALQQLAVRFPFWLTFELSRAVLAYIAVLTILSAAIVGVLPALKATGRRVQSGLQGLSAGSGSRMQMGRVWTLLIVAQVAVTVAVLPGTAFHAWSSLRFRAGSAGYAAHEFLTAWLTMERPTDVPPSPEAARRFRAEYGRRLTELERRLEADPAVSQVTYSLAPPGGELAAVVEVEGAVVPPRHIDYNIVEGARQGHLIRFNRVSPDFFAAFGVPLLTGRSFQPGDAGSEGAGVLVDRGFVDQLLGGQNPLGRRIRYVGRSREAGAGNVTLQRWYEIVGVVTDFPPHVTGGDPPTPRLYHAAAAEAVYPAHLAVRVRAAAPSEFADRLRHATTALDPALQLGDLSTAEEARRREQRLMRLIGTTLLAVIGSVVALSAAGIYALMSFTVARRRKEIGIRAALGADPARILSGVFSRAAGQLALGALIGLGGAAAVERMVEGEMFQGHGAVILPLVTVFMTLVGLLAAWGPARRGLRVQPTEALREE
jgi:predicted permease